MSSHVLIRIIFIVSMFTSVKSSRDDVLQDLSQLSSEVSQLTDPALVVEREQKEWTYATNDRPAAGTLRHMLNLGPMVSYDDAKKGTPGHYYNNGELSMPTVPFWQFMWDAAFSVYEPDQIEKKYKCQQPEKGALLGPKGISSSDRENVAHEASYECVVLHGDITAGDDHVSWALWHLPQKDQYEVGGVAIDCVVAFKGTDSLNDVRTDIAELNGKFDGWMGSKDRVPKAMKEVMESKPPVTCNALFATGHSLGGATAQNLALYEGVRAFVFSGPGPFVPNDSAAASFHDYGLAAIEASATIYNSPDRICFAAPHLGDKMCDVQQHQANDGWFGRLRTYGDSKKAMNHYNGHELKEDWFGIVSSLFLIADNVFGLSSRNFYTMYRQVAHHLGDHKSWKFAWDSRTCFEENGRMKFGKDGDHQGFWEVGWKVERNENMH